MICVRQILFMTAAVLALLAVGCAKEESPARGWDSDPDAVRVEASVGAITRTNPLGGEDSDKFSVGDKIAISNGTKTVKYQFDGTSWAPIADENGTTDYLVWDTPVTFRAWYPASRSHDGTEFILPSIQNQTGSGDFTLANADYMASDAYNYSSSGDIPGDRTFKPELKRRMALVTIVIDKVGDEYADLKDVMVQVKTINSAHSSVKLQYDGSFESEGGVVVVNPPYSHEVEGKSAYSAVVVPGAANKEEVFLNVFIDGYIDEAKTIPYSAQRQVTGIPAAEAGKHYTYKLVVGKETVKMGSVTVAPWTDKGSLGDNFGTDATEYSEWGGPEDVATAYAGGDGSKGNPYQIETAAQLALMAQRVNNGDYYIESTQTNQVTYFKLTSDIDLMGQEWTPIGYEQCSFCGIFDGGGHTILNLNVTNRYAGLFGVVKESAEIKNLTIRNASVKSRVIGKDTEGCSGIVAGKCEGQSSISNCSVEGSSSGNCYVGGIVGRIDKECKIRNCTAVVSCLGEEGSYSECGGIAGKSSATIENCTVRGNIKGTGNVGGFVGTMDGGKITSNTATLSCSYADVSLYSIPKYVQTYNVGGLVGECKGNSEVKVEAAAAVFGTVSVEPGLDADNGIIYLGGYIGYAEYTTLGGHFWGSIEAAKPSNGTLEAGIFMGYFGTGVTTGRSYCMYDKSRVGDLPIYGAKADGAKDDDLANIIAN